LKTSATCPLNYNADTDLEVAIPALEALRLALARRIAGTIFPDVTGLPATALLLTVEVEGEDLPTSDFLLIAIAVSLDF
jgi:hypothetical protein